MQMAIKVLYTHAYLKACISNSVTWALICCYNSFHSSAKAFSKISYPGCRIFALAQPQNHYGGWPLMSCDKGSQLAFHFIPKVLDKIEFRIYKFGKPFLYGFVNFDVETKNRVAFRFP